MEAQQQAANAQIAASLAAGNAEQNRLLDEGRAAQLAYFNPVRDQALALQKQSFDDYQNLENEVIRRDNEASQIYDKAAEANISNQLSNTLSKYGVAGRGNSRILNTVGAMGADLAGQEAEKRFRRRQDIRRERIGEIESANQFAGRPISSLSSIDNNYYSNKGNLAGQYATQSANNQLREQQFNDSSFARSEQARQQRGNRWGRLAAAAGQAAGRFFGRRTGS
jgi:hypothetical protein